MTADEIATTAELVRHAMQDALRRLRLVMTSDIPTDLWSRIQVVASQIATHPVEALAYKAGVHSSVGQTVTPLADLPTLPTLDEIEALLSEAVQLVDEIGLKNHPTELAPLVPAARMAVHEAYRGVVSLQPAAEVTP